MCYINFIFNFVAIYYSWTKYKELSSNSGNTTSTVLSVATGLDTYVNNERTWYWLSKYGFLPSCCQNTLGFCYFLLELDLLSGIKVIEVCLSFNIIIQGHPTEYFGKISVRIEDGLNILKYFSQRRSRLFKLFQKTLKFP